MKLGADPGELHGFVQRILPSIRQFRLWTESRTETVRQRTSSPPWIFMWFEPWTRSIFLVLTGGTLQEVVLLDLLPATIGNSWVKSTSTLLGRRRDDLPQAARRRPAGRSTASRS